MNIHKISISTLAFLGFVLLIGCGDKEDPNSPPTITTHQVEVLDGGGVFFTGEVTKHHLITDHGFIYGEDSSLRMLWTIPLNQPLKSGRFSHKLKVGLSPNQVYYFKAYININGHMVYGETKSFLSNGSVPPIIENVYPDKGYLGQTIKISGKNFGTNTIYTSVSFGEHRSHFLTVNDSLILVTIPPNLSMAEFPLTVTTHDKSAQVPYSLHTPEIAALEPNTGTFRSIITIKGDHFDTIPNRNQVLVGEQQAIILSSTRKEIKFIVPDDLSMGTSPLSITSQLQQVTTGVTFQLTAPLITEFPHCTATNNTFEIKGEFFNPIHNLNQVFFGETKADILGGDKNRLLVKVPHGPFPDAKTHIKVQIADIIKQDPKEICIEDAWVMISNSLPFSFYRDLGTFVIADKAYVIAVPKDYTDRSKYLWEYNPDNTVWTKSSLPFTSHHAGNSVGNGIKGYAYTAEYKDNFWEYNPSTKQWIKRADFPGLVRYRTSMFSIGKYVYLGIGDNLEKGNPEIYHDFYRYDPDNNQWTRIADLVTNPYWSRIKAGVFVIDNIAYLSGGSRMSNDIEAWKYDPGNNTWSRIADMPYTIYGNVHFSLNGLGYMSGNYGQSFTYNPHSNIWNQSYPIGHYDRFGAFSFVLKGRAYVGGGDTRTESGNYTLFKFMK